MREGDEIHLLRSHAERLQLSQQCHRNRDMHTGRNIRSLPGKIVVIAQARIPQQIALGMADQETRHRDFARFAVVVAGVGEAAEVLEHGVAAIERIEPQLGGPGEAGARRPQTQQQKNR